MDSVISGNFVSNRRSKFEFVPPVLTESAEERLAAMVSQLFALLVATVFATAASVSKPFVFREAAPISLLSLTTESQTKAHSTGNNRRPTLAFESTWYQQASRKLSPCLPATFL